MDKPVILVIDDAGRVDPAAIRRMLDALDARERILVVDECRLTSAQVEMMLKVNRMLTFDVDSYKVEHNEPVGETPKQIKHGPQHNTRKGKQRRW